MSRTAVTGMTKLVYLTPIAIPALMALRVHQRRSFCSSPYANVYNIANPKKLSAKSVYAQLANRNNEGMETSNISAHPAVRLSHSRRVQHQIRIIVQRAYTKWICCGTISDPNPSPQKYIPSTRPGNQ